MAIFSKKSDRTPPPPRRTISRASDDTTRVDERPRHTSQYRRGRTMAGSTSHTLRESHAHALHQATPREKMHHLANLRQKLIIMLVGLFVMVVVLGTLLQQFTASAAVELSGIARSVTSVRVYEASLQDYLSQRPLERFRFNIDHDAMTAFLHAKHPEVESVVSEGYESLATSRFEVTLRTPVVSWMVDEKIYYVDQYGVSFEKNVHDEPSVKIVDNSGVDYTSGAAIASERFLNFVGQAVARSNDAGVTVTEVSIPAGTSRQVALTLDGYEYEVIMSIDRSVGEQVEDMGRVVRHFNDQGRTPQYVDLRVKGKAFFRE
mgnify:CR=1 FL=1